MPDPFVRPWLETFMADFQAHADELGELDRLAGDGDFAVNMATGLRLTREALDGLLPGASDADVAFAASNTFLNIDGTSGPLLGMWLRDIAKTFAAESDPLAALAAGVTTGTVTVRRLGGAERGDKTMVDAMLPAAEALAHAHDAGESLSSAMRLAADAADAGAADTETLTARLGRASSVGDVAAGVKDAGAAAIALLFRSGAGLTPHDMPQ